MNPGEEPEDQEHVHLQGQAFDQARIFQARNDLIVAERDLHFHYVSGVRKVRRAEAEAESQECPYPGLAEFRIEQSRWFFGRDELVADLMVGLSARLWDGGPLAVVAPSGTGKSSLLRAGLLPAVRRGALGPSGSAQWPCLLLTPTTDPLQALATQLAKAIGVGAERAAEALSADPSAWVALAREALRERARDTDATEQRLLVIVDQFEELFTHCANEQERCRFIRSLSALAAPTADGEAPVALVVYGLRSDFYTQCVKYPELRASLQSDQFLIGPLSEVGLREAVEFPAQDMGLEVEPGLIELLLRDLGAPAQRSWSEDSAGSGRYEAGRLPLLAHALRATWQQKHGNVLTVEGYKATGGIDHAITASAERCFNKLDSSGKRAAQEIFLRLVKIGDGVADTRRRVSHPDLLKANEDPTAAAAVIKTFTEGRLLVQGQHSVEITHEALLRTWPRLRQWIDNDRAGNIIRQKLEEAAAEWVLNNGESSTLYRGSKLEEVRPWTASPQRERLSIDASIFLTTSVQHQKRGARLRRTAIAALSALALIASVTAVVAVQQRTTAQRQRDTAMSQQITVEANRLRPFHTSLASLLDIGAYRKHRDENLRTQLITDANGPLSTPLTGHTEGVLSVSFSPKAPILASSSFDKTVRLWSTVDPHHAKPLGSPMTGHTDIITSVSFSVDGQILASAGSNQLRLWNLADPIPPKPLAQIVGEQTGYPNTVAFSPDGHTLATGGDDETVRLWSLENPSRPKELSSPLTGHTDAISSVAFSPDGRTLASAGIDKTVRLWDLTEPTSPRQLASPLANTEPVQSVAFSPAGSVLASAGEDKLVRLWDLSDLDHPEQLAPALTGHTKSVDTVAFSPDGSVLASSGADQTMRLWNMTNPRHPEALGQPVIGHTARVAALAFGPDGRTLASSAGLNRDVLLWTLPNTVLADHAGDVLSVAFSPDGHTLASAGMDQTVRLRSLADHPESARQIYAAHPQGIGRVKYSPDGRTLASIGNDASVQLWDITDPDHPTEAGPLLTRHAKGLKAIALSRDLRVLAGATKDGSVHLWSLADPAHPQFLGQSGAAAAPPPGRASVVLLKVVWGLRFSPDGRMLVGIGPDRAMRLWNTADPAHPKPLGKPINHSNGVETVEFSPDGRTLASVEATGKLRLWDVRDPAHLKVLKQTHSFHGVYSVAFSPDGHTLASAGIDRTVRLWDVMGRNSPVQVGRALFGHTDSVFSVAFSPDGQTLASAGLDKTVHLWKLDAENAVERICRNTERSLNAEIWKQYVAEIPFKDPCS
ncbi:nSTAND1 domain-containing NTPase [Streptomyces sp. NPDC054863]